jgi:lipopolysaccharide export system protein LptC
MDERQPPEQELRAGNLDRLIHERNTTVMHNPGWSRFVRRMRLILPLIALGIFAIVFVWSDVEQNKIIPAKDLVHAPTVGKNELVNPRFESTDSDNQPFTITAKRAVQNKEDDNLVMLEKPLADMLMKSGEWVAVEAERGSFRQDNKMLLLRGNVRLYHDKGYELEMEELDIDLTRNTALSNTNVTGQGPEGTLASKGLKGNSVEGKIVFNGPVKLILTNLSGKKEKSP